MASLRATFIPSYSSTNPFFTYMSGIVSNTGSLFNNDEKEDSKKIKSE